MTKLTNYAPKNDNYNYLYDKWTAEGSNAQNNDNDNIKYDLANNAKIAQSTKNVQIELKTPVGKDFIQLLT